MDFKTVSRNDLENISRQHARSGYTGNAVLCRSLGMFNLYVDPLNTEMAPYHILDGYWESWITLAMARAIQPGWTVIDGGAAFGYYTQLFSHLVGHTGNVFSYEPVLTNFTELSAKACGHQNVTISRKAIADTTGNKRFEIIPCSGWSRFSDSSAIEVQCTTLDKEIDKADLIKLDIEGAEPLAWTGMQKLLDRSPNCIVVMEWDAVRWPNSAELVKNFRKRYGTLRIVNYDGGTNSVSDEELLAPGLQTLWLQ